jgi:hypothetical protein
MLAFFSTLIEGGILSKFFQLNRTTSSPEPTKWFCLRHNDYPSMQNPTRATTKLPRWMLAAISLTAGVKACNRLVPRVLS